MATRREFITGSSIAAIGMFMPRYAASESFYDAMKRIEKTVQGRLGVTLFQPGTNEQIAYRAEERFPMCSTFKLLASAAVLARVDAGKEKLARRVVFQREDLVEYSPATGKHVGGEGMTMAELCEAAITLSDNTAGNLILASLGGPAAITAFARSLGDPTTRLDRIETALNEATPGDPRDTTTPAAMVSDLRKLVLGDALKVESKKQLVRWLLASKTGGKRIRAGLPANWRFGDKTGTGGHGSTNDVGVIWTASGTPIVVAAYLTETAAPLEKREAALAETGKVIAAIVAN
jgi:beta-lactamase class A